MSRGYQVAARTNKCKQSFLKTTQVLTSPSYPPTTIRARVITAYASSACLVPCGNFAFLCSFSFARLILECGPAFSRPVPRLLCYGLVTNFSKSNSPQEADVCFANGGSPLPVHHPLLPRLGAGEDEVVAFLLLPRHSYFFPGLR